MKDLFFKTKDFIDVEYAFQEAREFSNRLNITYGNDLKLFKEEIFPTIAYAKYIGAQKVKFCGEENNSIDGVIKLNSSIINVECTTSIDARSNQLYEEYGNIYKRVRRDPHSKAINIKDGECVKTYDINFSGTKNKRTFVKQEFLSREEKEINSEIKVELFVEEDIKAIQKKINLGLERGAYKDYTLILSQEHFLLQDIISEYDNLISEYWNSINSNPFAHLFIVSYHPLLDVLSNPEVNINYNPKFNPLPLIFI